MAEAGKAEMVDAQTKSLVSEQYLDGWPFEDEDEDSETETTPSSHQQTDKQKSSGGVKRKYIEEGPEEKKFSLSLKGKSTHMATPSADGGGSSAPAKKTALNIGGSSSKSKTTPAPIKLKMSAPVQAQQESVLKGKKSSAVARAFGDSSSESEEEMPPEARMRMRNIGRETPTAAGPNSFGKGRLGFCDRQKIIERQLQEGAASKK